MRASHYAKALYELTASKQLDEGKLVSHFVDTIRANGDAHQLPRIMRAYEKLMAKTEKQKTIEVVSAKELSESDVAKLLKTDSFKKLLSPEHKKVSRRVDETLVGGAIVSVSGTRVDASYKRTLLDLYQSIVSG